jgi:hypothetical protein
MGVNGRERPAVVSRGWKGLMPSGGCGGFGCLGRRRDGDGG